MPTFAASPEPFASARMIGIPFSEEKDAEITPKKTTYLSEINTFPLGSTQILQ
jgi:hypothetical protein